MSQLKLFALVAILLMVLVFVVSHSFFFIRLTTGLGALAVLLVVVFLWGKLR